MKIRRVASKNLLVACRRFLGKDPITNVLPLGDLYSPLLMVSNIYEAIENNRIVGVCSIYRAYATPSIVLGNAELNVQQALVKKAVAEVSDHFITLCSPKDASLFEKHATALHSHPEQQMIANPPRQIRHDNIKVSRVAKDELESLNKFYVEHRSEVWTPLQFKVGPYYCVKHDGKIASAAGVHLVTPQIAQLGNIITDEAWRGRGFGTACTAALATDLASEARIISLFVRTDNAPAIHMYEKLGFVKRRNISFLVMQKRRG